MANKIYFAEMEDGAIIISTSSVNLNKAVANYAQQTGSLVKNSKVTNADFLVADGKIDEIKSFSFRG